MPTRRRRFHALDADATTTRVAATTRAAVAGAALAASLAGLSANAGPSPSIAYPRAVLSASPLDHYVARPDPAFAWRLEAAEHAAGATTYLVHLTSQTWLTSREVSHPAWTHWLRIVVPDARDTDTALLVIDGGRRRDEAPRTSEGILTQLATATRSIVVQVPNVPNQPIELAGDGKGRFEDDLLAESWLYARKTMDPGWIVHLAMVKSAVAAMTAAEQFLSAPADEQRPADPLDIAGWIVTGGSKRGWTTWLTAAVDTRVKGIIPLVIDTLNMPEVMKHHWGAYGFWAPAINDYSSRGLVQMLGSPESQLLRLIVDPFLFRDRLTMPKFILNAGGDEFFLPDTTRHWIHQLAGDWRLRVVPNRSHGEWDIAGISSAIAFFWCVSRDLPMPTINWQLRPAQGAPTAEGWQQQRQPVELVLTPSERPQSVTLWTVDNPGNRDFRVVEIGRAWKPVALSPEPDGTYIARVDAPAQGFRAFLVEAVLPTPSSADGASAPFPMTLSTEVYVIPDVLPHADKPIE